MRCVGASMRSGRSVRSRRRESTQYEPLRRGSVVFVATDGQGAGGLGTSDWFAGTALRPGAKV